MNQSTTQTHGSKKKLGLIVAIAAAAVVVVVAITALVFSLISGGSNNADDSAKNSKSTSKEKEKESSEDTEFKKQKAIAEATKVAEEYYKAKFACDRAKMDSLLAEPVDDERFSTCEVGNPNNHAVSSFEFMYYENHYDDIFDLHNESVILHPIVTGTNTESYMFTQTIIRRNENLDGWKVMY